MSKQKQNGKHQYDIRVDKVPYHVEVSPFNFNDETRFTIRINDGDEHIYAWDKEAVQLRAIDDESAILPDGLEKELSDQLVKTLVQN